MDGPPASLDPIFHNCLEQGVEAQAKAVQEISERMRSALTTSLESSLRQMEALYEERLGRREQELLGQIAYQEATIHSLQAQVEEESRRRSAAEERLDRFSFCAAHLSERRANTETLRRIVLAWKKQAERTRRARRLEVWLKRSEERHSLAFTFLGLTARHGAVQHEKRMAELKFKYDTLAADMVHRYENELARARSALAEAYQEVQSEQQRRQQMEEEVKRLLLKNMTAMNMEALAIFKNASTSSTGGPILGLPPSLSMSGDKAVGASSPPPPPPAIPQTATTTASPAVNPNPTSSSMTPMPIPSSSSEILPSSVVESPALERLGELYRLSLSAAPKLATNAPSSTANNSSSSSTGSRKSFARL